jgi:Uncharacterized Fe-S protein
MNSSEPVGTVRALWRFPVKSMLGEQLDVVEVGEGGMTGDRGVRGPRPGDGQGREREAPEAVARPAQLPGGVC